jgi:hypothetical protein
MRATARSRLLPSHDIAPVRGGLRLALAPIGFDFGPCHMVCIMARSPGWVGSQLFASSTFYVMMDSFVTSVYSGNTHEIAAGDVCRAIGLSYIWT